ncbi:hypothetical protein RB195_008064 [Necator americanus]|uniref:F-box domain-containing protein n=1 Tax=Necator americanus TaxID=51031 RepID=A0ABR1C2K5_NECAM
MATRETTTLRRDFDIDPSEPSSSRRKEEHEFPWVRLPNELQVKVLKNLQRRDLRRCRSVNKQMSEIIRNNERSMKRRRLDLVRIERIGQGRMQLSMRCDEEAVNRKWVACQKRRKRHPTDLAMDIKKAFVNYYHIDVTAAAPVDALGFLGPHPLIASEPNSSSELPTAIVDRLAEVATGSEIDRLRINEMELSDAALRQIANCLRSTECRVRLLSFELTSFSSVTPNELLRFVLDVAPTDLVFRMVRGCTQEHFGREMCRFIVTRRFFSVSELVDAQSNDVPLSIDDVLLNELSASTFQMGASNAITVDGLRSLVKAFANGTKTLVAGSIKTSFPLKRIAFPFSGKAKVQIENEKIINISSIAAT